MLSFFALLTSSLISAHTQFEQIVKTSKGITLSVKDGISVAEKELLLIDIYNRFNQQFFNDTLEVFVSLNDGAGANLFDSNNRYLTCGFNQMPRIGNGSPAMGKSVLSIYSSKNDFDIPSILNLILWAANNPKKVLARQRTHVQHRPTSSEVPVAFVSENEIKKIVAKPDPSVDRFLSQKFVHNKIQRQVTCWSLAYSYENGTFDIQNQVIGHHQISGNDVPKTIISVNNLQDIRCDDNHNCIIAAGDRYYFYSSHTPKHLDTISEFLLPGIEIVSFGQSCLSLRIAYLKTAFAEIYYNRDTKICLIRPDNGAMQFSAFDAKSGETAELLLPLVELILSGLIVCYILYNVNTA
jgi:hypothetical protein